MAAALPSSGTTAFRQRSAPRRTSAIVHGIPDDYTLKDGDLISIDAGAIYEGWHGDAAFTAAVGEVPRNVQRLLDVTEEALWNGLRQSRVGKRLGDIGHAINSTAEPFGFGVVQEYVGHGIGRQMHEAPNVPNYGTPGRGLKIKTGMALAIEPMFNIGGPETAVLEDEWTVVTADGSLSAPLRAHGAHHRGRPHRVDAARTSGALSQELRAASQRFLRVESPDRRRGSMRRLTVIFVLALLGGSLWW